MGGCLSCFNAPIVRSNNNTLQRQTNSSDIYIEPQTVRSNYDPSRTQTEIASRSNNNTLPRQTNSSDIYIELQSVRINYDPSQTKTEIASRSNNNTLQRQTNSSDMYIEPQTVRSNYDPSQTQTEIASRSNNNTLPRQTNSSDIYIELQSVRINYDPSQTKTESLSLRPPIFVSPSNCQITNKNEYFSDNCSSVGPVPRKRSKIVRPKPASLFSPKLPTPQLAKQNYRLIEGITKTEMYDLNWKPIDNNKITLVTLSSNSFEYRDIYKKFYMYMGRYKRNYDITSIKKIQNPYLLAAFQIKQQEIRRKFGRVTIMELFHGTKKQNISSIREENFNWRLHGRSLGHRFGKGVSFSHKSSYSKHYCDRNNSIEKVMILAYVLVAASCSGNNKTSLPPPSYDTTQKPNGDVIVKYDDNEFYPAYEIYFREMNVVLA